MFFFRKSNALKRLFLLAIFIAVLAAFFASTHPDGLDSIAKQFGFAARGVEHAAPLSGLPTPLAGIAGVLIAFALFWLSACIMKGREKMKKIITLLLLVSAVAATPSLAIAPYIFANTTAGMLGGGLGFDLNNGHSIDFSATAGSGPSGSTYQLYADYFISCWGVGLIAKKATVNSDLAYNLSLLFAPEQAINDKITVGASFTVVNYDTTAGADPNWTILPTVGVYIKLPLQ